MNDNTNNKMSEMTNLRFAAAKSRRLLISALKALSPFMDAVTVIGAHAVHVWVENAWGKITMEATRDADVSINPLFVVDSPKIIDALREMGLEPTLKSRPGIYGLIQEANLPLEAKTTFDILVPEAYAGGGRRSARIPGQKNAAGRAVGLELTLWDRHLINLSTVEGSPEEIMAYVAGPASLLVAKAHKVHERLEQSNTRPSRLRPKDSGDIALLMMVADPAEVSSVMHDVTCAHPEVKEAVENAAQWLIEMYADLAPASLTRQHAADSLAARFDEQEVLATLDRWTAAFKGC